MGKKLEKVAPFRIFEEENFENAIECHNQFLQIIKHDKKSPLWDFVVDINEYDKFRKHGSRYIDPDIKFEHREQQKGGTCLSTCLAILTTGLTRNKKIYTDVEVIEKIRMKVNSGAPRTWSEFLFRNTDEFRLAYCNTDHRWLEYYIDELVRHDDLFLVSWYSKSSEDNHQPDEDGSIGGSHVVIWWKEQIIDTNRSATMHYTEYFEDSNSKNKAVKRIFRVVAPWSIHRL